MSRFKIFNILSSAFLLLASQVRSAPPMSINVYVSNLTVINNFGDNGDNIAFDTSAFEQILQKKNNEISKIISSKDSKDIKWTNVWPGTVSDDSTKCKDVFDRCFKNEWDYHEYKNKEECKCETLRACTEKGKGRGDSGDEMICELSENKKFFADCSAKIIEPLSAITLT